MCVDVFHQNSTTILSNSKLLGLFPSYFVVIFAACQRFSPALAKAPTTTEK